MSGSTLSTAVDALVVAAGLTISSAHRAEDIPGHRVGLDAVVRIRAVESGPGATRTRDVYEVQIETAAPLTMRAPAGHRQAVTTMEAVRDSLSGGGALATVPARVISVGMETDEPGNATTTIRITATIHALR